MYKAERKVEFPWLEVVTDDSSEVVGLLCCLCKRHKRKNKYNQSTIWSEKSCYSLQKDAVACHSLTQQYKEAIEMEACRQEVAVHGGVEQAFQTQLQLKRQAVITAMQCLYWSEIPHTGNYESLLKVVQLMGCQQLKHLNQGENAKYTSQRIIQEFLQVMAVEIESQTL